MVTILEHTHDPGSAAIKRGRRALIARPAPVSVNDITIPRDEIARETQYHPAARPIEAWQAAARALVVRELLLQEAHRLGMAPEPITDDEGRRETDDEALIRMLVEREVKIPEADEASCRRIYARNRERFRSSELYAVRHILIAAPPRDMAARAEALRLAEAIIGRLLAAPSLFAAMAADHSACPSKSNGGNLGQISRGQTVPEFEAALASLAGCGLAESAIETRYGFHIVMLDQRLEGQDLPFEVVHRQIAQRLSERARYTAVREYIGMLSSRATITGIELDSGRIPDVG